VLRCARDTASGLRGLCQKGVSYPPLVQFAACRTVDAHILVPDAEQRADLCLNATVDLPSRGGANENEVLHRESPPHAHYSGVSCRDHDIAAIAR
jgi:hypothetical protein